MVKLAKKLLACTRKKSRIIVHRLHTHSKNEKTARGFSVFDAVAGMRIRYGLFDSCETLGQGCLNAIENITLKNESESPGGKKKKRFGNPARTNQIG